MMETILISAGAALGGVIVGSIVQRTAKFLYPYDWMTMVILTAIIVDAILLISGIDPVWYAPFLLGYAVGYMIVGRTRYKMVMDINIPSKTMRMKPWVIYIHGEHLCIQEQSNRALLRRQICGVRHIILSVDGAPVNTDWYSHNKYPLFPVFEKELIVLEDVKVDYYPVKVFWRFHARQYVTRVRVAYGSMASKLELMRSAEVLTEQQEVIVSLANEVSELQSALGPQLMEMAIAIDNTAVSTSPENRMFEVIKNKRNPKKEIIEEVISDGPAESTDPVE